MMKRRLALVFLLGLSQIPSLAQGLDYMVVIDPGHGGKDPGAILENSTVVEKDINLKIGKLVKQKLERRADNIYPFMTRDEDSTLSLEERVEKVYQQGAIPGIFLSIHLNSHNTKKKVEGVEVYYFHSQDVKTWTRNIETSKDKDWGLEDMKNFYAQLDEIYLQHALKDFPQDWQKNLLPIVEKKIMEESKDLAQFVGESVAEKIKKPLRKVQAFPYFVIAHNIFPSILIETGFITDKDMQSHDFQNRIADGIVAGIFKYLEKIG